MVRKKRGGDLPGGSSESQESGAGGGRGSQRPPERAAAPPQQGGGYQGGRGWGPQSQAGGVRGGYAGRGRGGMPHQQQYGGPGEYQARGRGGPPQQGGRGGYGGRGGGGRGGPSFGGPSRPPAPELHQASPAPYQPVVNPQSVPSESGSLTQPEELASTIEKVQELTIQHEAATSQAIQPLPASSKSVRFPLRPGKGSTGTRCIVKANHFFAELPDRDLHQYDVSYLCPSYGISYG